MIARYSSPGDDRPGTMGDKSPKATNKQAAQKLGLQTVPVHVAENLTPEQVMAVKQLSQEQVQYIKGYADALENVVMR